MFEMVLEPLTQGLSKGKKGKKSNSGSTRTQAELRNSGLTPKDRDSVLMNKLGAMGFKS